MRRSTVALLLAPAILFLLFGFVAPIAVGLGESLRAGLGLYGKIFGDAYYLEVIASTLALSAAVPLMVRARRPRDATDIRCAGRPARRRAAPGGCA